jgi:hypothetical protein
LTRYGASYAWLRWLLLDYSHKVSVVILRDKYAKQTCGGLQLEEGVTREFRSREELLI